MPLRARGALPAEPARPRARQDLLAAASQAVRLAPAPPELLEPPRAPARLDREVTRRPSRAGTRAAWAARLARLDPAVGAQSTQRRPQPPGGIGQESYRTTENQCSEIEGRMISSA